MAVRKFKKPPLLFPWSLKKQMVWKVFVVLHYNNPKRMFSDNLIFVTCSKRMHKHFEEVAENVFSWEKRCKFYQQALFYTGFKPWNW